MQGGGRLDRLQANTLCGWVGGGWSGVEGLFAKEAFPCPLIKMLKMKPQHLFKRKQLHLKVNCDFNQESTIYHVTQGDRSERDGKESEEGLLLTFRFYSLKHLLFLELRREGEGKSHH